MARTFPLHCVQVLDISRRGLASRGHKEEQYLAPIQRIADSGVTLAEHMLQRYDGEWSQSVDPVFGPDYQY